MSEILIEIKNPSNVKPDSWYEEFYGDWILEFYKGLHSIDECIKFQKEYDKNIDNNQLETPKICEYDYNEFILQNNSYEKNRELLIIYEQQQLLYEVEGEKKDLELRQLFNKCFEALEQGYLITNQLFIFYIWFESDEEYNYIDNCDYVYIDDGDEDDYLYE